MVLPAEKRQAAQTVLAFCRLATEAMHSTRAAEGRTEGCCSCDQTATLLRQRVRDAYAGSLTDRELPSDGSDEQQVLRALGSVVSRYQIPPQHLIELIDGLARDAVVQRHATWTSLQRHCHATGGVVALALADVLGLTHSDAGRSAAQLGVAVALTRILCDVGADQQRGRVYLPLEDMLRFKYSERELLARQVNDRFRSLMQFEVERASRLYREAVEGIAWLAGDPGKLVAAGVVAVQRGLLDAIRRQHYNVFARVPSLSLSEKLRRLPEAWRIVRLAHPPDAHHPSLSDASW